MTQAATPPALPAPLNGAGKTITQRLSDIEATVNALLAGTEARHNEILRAVAQMAPAPVEFPDLSGLEKAVKAHGEKITALEWRELPKVPDLAPLETRVKALEDAPPLDLPVLEGPDLAPLEDRVKHLEERPAPEPPEMPDLAPIEQRVKALESALGLDTPVAAVEPASAQRSAKQTVSGTPLDPATPGYAAYMADGKYTTVEAITAATDAELIAVKGVAQKTVEATRAHLGGNQ